MYMKSETSSTVKKIYSHSLLSNGSKNAHALKVCSERVTKPSLGMGILISIRITCQGYVYEM